MKQQIAGFLGELAEELGWAPELDEARVRTETSRPERPGKPAVLTPDPRNLRSLSTPIDRMRIELDQLRATVKHLGSEVIQLRAQMAQLRRLPLPPDADDAALMEVEGGSHKETMEPEAGPWAPHLVTTAVTEPVSVVSSHHPVPAGSPAVEVPRTAPAPEPVGRGGNVESTVDDTPDISEPEATSDEVVTDPVATSVDDRSLAPTTTGASAPASDVDEPEDGLELFASESAQDEADRRAGGKNPSAADTPDRADKTDKKGLVKSLYRRMGGGTT